MQQNLLKLSLDFVNGNFFAVIERFEVLERCNPGDTCADDLPNVLKLRKELCEAQVYPMNSSILM